MSDAIKEFKTEVLGVWANFQPKAGEACEFQCLTNDWVPCEVLERFDDRPTRYRIKYQDHAGCARTRICRSSDLRPTPKPPCTCWEKMEDRLNEKGFKISDACSALVIKETRLEVRRYLPLQRLDATSPRAWRSPSARSAANPSNQPTPLRAADIMSKVTSMAIGVDLKVTLELNEIEARALCGIFGYDVEQFLKVFYERMGRAYVEPHENGVRSLHKTVRGQLEGPLEKVREAKKLLADAAAKGNYA